MTGTAVLDPLLPGATAGAPAGSSRLLLPAAAGGTFRDLAAHERRYGPLPTLGRRGELIALLREAGLTGRGGAGFPTYRKLEAVRAGRRPVVVGNGAEGEPASGKDKLLLSLVPHLVLDGLALVAEAVGAHESYLYVHAGPLVDDLRLAVASRRGAGVTEQRVEVVDAPARFLSGQESAVAARLSGRPALPRATPPPVYEKGVRNRPTLVQNVETLAHIGLIARYGAGWFRAVGTADEPGTMLCSVGGDVARPGVVEAVIGTPVTDILDAAGGPTGALGAVLVGGYHGAWLPVGGELRMSVAGLRPHGALPGAGVLVALGAGRCGLTETARAVGYLAGESAGQCGPCLNGLPALADTFRRLAAGDRDPHLVGRVHQLAGLLEKRGACHHPDGSVRFARSALVVFDREVRAHLRGTCTASDHSPVLPIPAGPPPAARPDQGAPLWPTR